MEKDGKREMGTWETSIRMSKRVYVYAFFLLYTYMQFFTSAGYVFLRACSSLTYYHSTFEFVNYSLYIQLTLVSIDETALKIFVWFKKSLFIFFCSENQGEDCNVSRGATYPCIRARGSVPLPDVDTDAAFVAPATRTPNTVQNLKYE